MSILPSSLVKVIDVLGKLPGVGPRTAERYAFQLLKADPGLAENMSKAISQLHGSVKNCPITFMLIDVNQDISPIYDDPSRNKRQVAVVEDSLDVVALEKTRQFTGTYHVLGGALSPIDGVGPESLRINELVARIENDSVEEVILATNASVEGESTALFLNRRLENIKGLKVTRLARGLPAGIDLEYADQITLTRALEGRQAL